MKCGERGKKRKGKEYEGGRRKEKVRSGKEEKWKCGNLAKKEKGERI